MNPVAASALPIARGSGSLGNHTQFGGFPQCPKKVFFFLHLRFMLKWILPLLLFKGICNKGIFSANAWSYKNVPELFSCPKVAASKCNAETMCDLQQHREKINHLKTKEEWSIFLLRLFICKCNTKPRTWCFINLWGLLKFQRKYISELKSQGETPKQKKAASSVSINRILLFFLVHRQTFLIQELTRS